MAGGRAEPGADHGGVVGDAGAKPLASRNRRRPGVARSTWLSSRMSAAVRVWGDQVVDAGELGHALGVPLLALGQVAGKLAGAGLVGRRPRAAPRGTSRCLCRRRRAPPSRCRGGWLVTSCRRHPRRPRRRWPALDRAVGDRNPVATDRLGGVGKRPAGGLQGSQAAQLVRVPLDWQVDLADWCTGCHPCGDGIDVRRLEGRLLATGGPKVGVLAGQRQGCPEPAGAAKTDRQDAIWLAKVAERGMCQPSLVHPRPIRQLRDLTRNRRSLIRGRTGRCNAPRSCGRTPRSSSARWSATSTEGRGGRYWRYW